MGYYLLDHRNPNGDHFYSTRRRPIKAIVVHVTAGLEDTDLIGPDHSAENTARYAATTDRAVSWQSGSDTDTFLDLLPYSYTAFQCVNYNSSTAGHEISKRDVVWADEKPEWVSRTLRMAAVGPDGRGGLALKARQNGIPLRRATRAELDRAIATDGPPVGFVTHAELDPARRTDPGRDFPWTRFFALMAAPPKPTVPEDDMPYTKAELQTIVQAAVRAELSAIGGESRVALRGLAAMGARDAVGAAIAAVRADQAVSGQREAKALSMLTALEADLPNPTPEA